MCLVSECASSIDLTRENQEPEDDMNAECEQENSSGLSWGSRKRRSKNRHGKGISSQVCVEDTWIQTDATSIMF